MNVFSTLSAKKFLFGYGCVLAMSSGSVVVHEYGHMTAMRLFYKHIDPYMYCDGIPGFSGCYATWGGIPVLRKGLWITDEAATGIVAAAGPIADIANIAISSLVAWKMRHSTKKISLLFASHACYLAFKSLDYCLFTPNDGDYANVEKYLGIPLNIQAAMMSSVTLGATMLAGYLAFHKRPI